MASTSRATPGSRGRARSWPATTRTTVVPARGAGGGRPESWTSNRCAPSGSGPGPACGSHLTQSHAAAVRALASTSTRRPPGATGASAACSSSARTTPRAVAASTARTSSLPRSASASTSGDPGRWPWAARRRRSASAPTGSTSPSGGGGRTSSTSGTASPVPQRTRPSTGPAAGLPAWRSSATGSAGSGWRRARRSRCASSAARSVRRTAPRWRRYAARESRRRRRCCPRCRSTCTATKPSVVSTTIAPASSRTGADPPVAVEVTSSTEPSAPRAGRAFIAIEPPPPASTSGGGGRGSIRVRCSPSLTASSSRLAGA